MEKVSVTRKRIFQLAAKEMLINMPFANDEFNPTNKKACIRKLKIMEKEGILTFPWLSDIASANISGMHTFIQFTKEREWKVVAGFNKKAISREEFVLKLYEERSKISKEREAVKAEIANAVNDSPETIIEPLESTPVVEKPKAVVSDPMENL
jgi:hypothetical protein